MRLKSSLLNKRSTEYLEEENSPLLEKIYYLGVSVRELSIDKKVIDPKYGMRYYLTIKASDSNEYKLQVTVMDKRIQKFIEDINSRTLSSKLRKNFGYELAPEVLGRITNYFKDSYESYLRWLDMNES